MHEDSEGSIRKIPQIKKGREICMTKYSKSNITKHTLLFGLLFLDTALHKAFYKTFYLMDHFSYAFDGSHAKSRDFYIFKVRHKNNCAN